MVSSLDIWVIILYLVITLIVGVLASRRQHLEGYLTNNRRTGLLLLTLSNVATLVGAGAVVAVASAAYTTGISYGLVVMSSLVLTTLLFAWLARRIKMFGDATKAHTVGDFFMYRFGRRARYLYAASFIIVAFLWGSIQYVALAQLLAVFTGINFLFAVVVAAAITIIYTSLAGIMSDLLTDFVQFWVMLIAFIILLPLAVRQGGGINAVLSLPPTYFDPFAFGGTTFFIAGIFLAGLVLLPSVHYWQRIYSAKSVQVARNSYLLSIPFMIFFVLASVLVGLVAVTVVPGVEPDSSLFVLMQTVLPSGILGLGLASIAAVVMSSIDSLLLGGSATILKDIYMPLFHPTMHEHELLNMARYITAIFGIISASVAFLAQDIVKLSLLTSFTALCLVPAIGGGLLWRRTTSAGAIASILSALAVLYATMPFIPKVSFLPAFVAGTAVLIVVSRLTRHSGEEHQLDA